MPAAVWGNSSNNRVGCGGVVEGGHQEIPVGVNAAGAVVALPMRDSTASANAVSFAHVISDGESLKVWLARGPQRDILFKVVGK